VTTRTSFTRRILVGIDGSPASVAAVRWAASEARLRGMRVHVVHVRERRVPAPAHYAPLSGAGDSSAGRSAGESTLKAVVQEALGPEPQAAVQMELADGLPSRVLLDRADGAEMLVLGSSRPGGGPAAALQPRIPLGPVTRDCLRAAPCPVVVVRPSGVESVAEPAHAR
jgi:nucleotide-binding universal stress UspA family protein